MNAVCTILFHSFRQFLHTPYTTILSSEILERLVKSNAKKIIAVANWRNVQGSEEKIRLACI